MKTAINNNKATIGIGVLLIASLIGTGSLYLSNQSIKNNLKEERLKNELMLSEKLSLNKAIQDYNFKINTLINTNEELENRIEKTTKELAIKEAEATKLSRENNKVKSLKKQLAELNTLKKENETKILALKETINKLKSDNEFLNQSLTALTTENRQLAANLELLSSITADNYLMETTKRTGKLTVVAKRTKKLAINFKVPENVVESISFKLTKPDGVTIDGKSKDLAVNITNYNEILYANNSKDEIKVSKKIEMTYQPKEKLKAGIYKVEIYNKDKYIGTCNVKLR